MTTREIADLNSLFRLLWRRKAQLGLVVLLFLVGAVAALSQMERRYTATALLVLENRETQIVEVAAVVSRLPADSAVVHSEAQILKSRALAEALVDAFSLTGDPAFNPALAAPRLWDVLHGGPVLDPEGAQARTLTLAAVQRAVSVQVPHRSHVLALSVTAPQAEQAATLANGLARLYLEHQRDGKAATVRQAAQWLEHRAATLRQEVAEAEAAVAAYRRQHQLGQGADQPLTAQYRADLSLRLGEVGAEVSALAARRSRLLAALSSNSLEAVPEALASPVIQHLRQQEAETRRLRADLATRYGPLHPRMAETAAALEDISGQIQAEGQRILASITDSLHSAQARHAATEQALAATERQRGQEGEAALILDELEREAASRRALYEALLVRVQETAGQEALSTPDARLASAAAVPDRPSWPRPLLVLGAALGGGLMVGLVILFACEHLDRRFRHPDEVEHRLGLPVFGQTPQNDPPALAEEMRGLRTTLSLCRGGGALPSVIAVTSSLPEEGKTALCLALGRALAPHRRVVVVDGDLRRPALLPRHNPGPSLPDLLAGTTDLDAVLRPGPVSGLTLLPGRPVGGGVVDEVLEGAAFPALIARLKERFEVVVIDTPPLLPVADARLLTRLADVVLFALRWESTPEEAAAQGVARLRDALKDLDPPPPLGAVLTRVNLRRQRSYGYGGSGNYAYPYASPHAS